MTEEVNHQLSEAKKHMEASILHLEEEMAKVRAGKANPSMLDGLTVDYYGTPTPINQVANVNNQDVKTLVIQPWEKNMLEDIEKIIIGANLGVTPQNDGNVIRLVVPPLTEERRTELVKKIKEIAEQGKVSIRNVRRDANEKIKLLAKDGLGEDESKIAEELVQEYTNDFIQKVDKHFEAKEQEIMTV
ncbi:MAG: ribosome recycling factor [Bacteroidetes bacterium]|nr:ribosome recycling factor [Bacteroidota bacterium]